MTASETVVNIDEITEGELLSYLANVVEDYDPHLDTVVNLAEYSHKLTTQGVVFAACSAGMIVGILAGYFNNLSTGFAFVSQFHVLGNYRRLHVGRKLMDTARSYAQEKGFTHIRLMVSKDNHGALAFYKGYGFECLREDQAQYELQLRINPVSEGNQQHMTIFVIGQCTLHWGRMEFGNIGNYYIAEPFFRELHRVFPDADIKTTFQMSDGFCQRENVRSVPMSEYYSWSKDDLPIAEKEYAAALEYSRTGRIEYSSPYIEDCLTSDLIIDFSGDIWGRNADLVGPNRFRVGILKDRVAQLLGKPTAMIAGSPGPFNYDGNLNLAHDVFSAFKFVSNREAISRTVLSSSGFDVSNVMDCTCPAFMFDAASEQEVAQSLAKTALASKVRPAVGFILCGWNMLKGPFNREDWTDEEFLCYVNALHNFLVSNNVYLFLMSHSNGFVRTPVFRQIKGRDYPIVEHLYTLLRKTEVANSVFLLDDVYSPKVTKGIIRHFDMLVSGRVHGAVAGLSQNVPTVIIDYGHEPKAHKLQGFARVAGVEDCIANPGDVHDLEAKMSYVWLNRDVMRKRLSSRNKWITDECQKQFDALRLLV